MRVWSPMEVKRRLHWRLLPTLLVLLLLPVASGFAADSLYEAAKITVDTTAKDAVTARQMGMAEAQMRAAQIVLRRLVAPSIEQHLPPLSKEDVENMVNGVSIRKEQNSTTRYIATLDVSFNDGAVQQFLMDQGIPYSENRAPSISILPLVVAGDSGKGGDPEGWRRAWEDLDLAHSVTPATLLRPRDDLEANTVKAALAGEGEALAKLQADYGGYAPLVIAVAKMDSGTCTTRLIGADAVGDIDDTRSESDAGSPEATARAAASAAFAALENRWRTQAEGGGPAPGTQYEESALPPQGLAGPTEGPASAPGEVPRNVVAVVEFSGLKDWQDIRARLAQIAGILRLEVNALSARSAAITFDYAGSLGHLEAALGQNGFAIDERDGTLVLHSR